MPSLSSLLLRYFAAFVLWLLLGFGGLVGLSMLAEEGLRGPWGFLAMLVIALLAAAQSTGKHIGRISGRFPSEGVAWRFSVLVSVVLLLGFLLLLIQAERGGIEADLPGPEDATWADFVVRTSAVFLPLATILTRFGIFIGAAAGVQKAGRRVAAGHAPAAGSSFDPRAGGQAGQPPGVIAMVGRLILLNLAGAVLLIVAGFALAVAGYGIDPSASWPSTLVAIVATYLAGRHYGKRARRAMPSDVAWAVSGLYMLVSVVVTGAVLAYLLAEAGVRLPNDMTPGVAAVVLGGAAVVLFVMAFIVKALLRVGSNAGLRAARAG